MIRKRKKKSKIYFGTPVHDAIIKYNHSEDTQFRHTIYTEEIHAAFMKLAENIINTYKFMYFDYPFRDLQAEDEKEIELITQVIEMILDFQIELETEL